MAAQELVTIAEHNHLSEMHADLRRKLQEVHKKETNGRLDGLRASVMGAIVSENYDRAREELRDYIEFRGSYPAFQDRALRYSQHCNDLIQAIQTKRNFPGLAMLSLAKQQEIHEKVLEHFEELKGNLKQIESVERENKIEDLRSTVWVVQAFGYSLIGLFVAAFLVDLHAGLFTSFFQVSNHYADQASTWLVNLVRF